MRVNPQSPKFIRAPARIDLPIKEVGHGLVIELDMDPRARLPGQLHIFHKQQVVLHRDPKSADLGITYVAQEQELGPGRGAEPQRRRAPGLHRHVLRLRRVLLHGI